MYLDMKKLPSNLNSDWAGPARPTDYSCKQKYELYWYNPSKNLIVICTPTKSFTKGVYSLGVWSSNVPSKIYWELFEATLGGSYSEGGILELINHKSNDQDKSLCGELGH